MRHLYSGNAADHKHAVKAIESLCFKVSTTEGYQSETRKHVLIQTIRLLDGDTLIRKEFFHYDIDCLFIEATLWLREMYKQLKAW